MGGKFRVRLNLDGFESRLVPSGVTGDAPAQSDPPTSDLLAAKPRLQINLTPTATNGQMIDGNVITIKMTAGNQTYDSTFTVNGPTTVATQTQIIADEMKREGWDVVVTGDQLVVYGHRDPSGVYTPVSSGGASTSLNNQQSQPSVSGDNGVKVIKVEPPKAD